MKHGTTPKKKPEIDLEDDEELLAGEASITVSKEEIVAAYENYLIEQGQSYLQALPGSESSDSDAPVPSIVDLHSQFDAEHLEGIIRSLVAARPHLYLNVGVFPVFNVDAMQMQAKDLVVNKILADPEYQYLVKDSEPLAERSLIAHFPQLLAERDEEELLRNQQDQEVNQLAEQLLSDNEMNQEHSFFRWHLEAIAFSEHSFLGNVRNKQLLFGHCEQFIIPFRQVSDEGCHYTVAVVNCSQENGQAKAWIQYYDSCGYDLEEQYQEQLVNFFCDDMGYDEVQYDCISQRDQKDKINCSIFAGLKAIDIANENVNNDERFIKDLNARNYAERLLYFRIKIADLLSQAGYNIEIAEELTEADKRQQARFKQQALRTELKDKKISYKLFLYGAVCAGWIGYRLWNQLPSPLPDEILNAGKILLELGVGGFALSQLGFASHDYAQSRKRKADELDSAPFCKPIFEQDKKRIKANRSQEKAADKKGEPILNYKNGKKNENKKQGKDKSKSSGKSRDFKKRRL